MRPHKVYLAESDEKLVARLSKQKGDASVSAIVREAIRKLAQAELK